MNFGGKVEGVGRTIFLAVDRNLDEDALPEGHGGYRAHDRPVREEYLPHSGFRVEG